jgi:acetyl-CoA acetyltransferase
MLTTREEAERRGLPVLGTLRSFAAVGVPPSIMGTAPLVAIPKVLERAGLSKDDVDVFELNEAFASQVGGWVGGWVRGHCLLSAAITAGLSDDSARVGDA